jgi:hypothetical protein
VKMGPTRPETSVNNYHTTPRNIPEERRSQCVLYSVYVCEGVGRVAAPGTRLAASVYEQDFCM